MTEKTFKETFEAFSNKMLDLNPEYESNRNTNRIFHKGANEPDWESLYYNLPDGCDITVDTGNFISLITVSNNECEEYEFITNAISGNYFDYWIGFQHFEGDDAYSLKDLISRADQYLIDRECATLSLKELQEELTDDVLEKVFKGHDVVIFSYLLTNPRKDVVEWALKHKEELGLKGVKRKFVEEYQVVPELKELILNTLGKKGV